MQIIVIKKSDVNDIVDAIEKARKQFQVPLSNVIVDQDGVGAATVKTADYKGFSGGSTPKKVEGLKENYKNLKTQCYYYLADEKVNMNDIRVNITNETCIVDGVRGIKIKLGGKLWDITELIRDDLRAIKRDKIDMDGKICINSKEEQKVILGRSPDFGDSLMMRSWFEFRVKDEYL